MDHKMFYVVARRVAVRAPRLSKLPHLCRVAAILHVLARNLFAATHTLREAMPNPGSFSPGASVNYPPFRVVIGTHYEFENRRKKLSIDEALPLEWEDHRLSWAPPLNENIRLLQYYQDDLWTPAIVVSNCLTDLSAIDEETIPLRVSYDGSVSWHPPGIFTTGCEMDTTRFPFDIQTCSIQVTSFGYTLQEVVVNSTDGLRMDYYSESGDWEIVSVWDTFDTYTDSGNAYARVTFYIEMKRLNTYHWLNILLPVIVSGSLIVFVFVLPVESGEKMGYSLTCLLTYVVLLTMIAADMPTTADHTSYLEVYLTIVLILSGFAVVCCIVSIRLYQMDEDEKIPHFIVKTVKKCWPLVDGRKDSAKASGQNKGKIRHEGGKSYDKEARDLSSGTFAEKKKGISILVRRMSSASVVSNDDYSEDLIDGKCCSIVIDKMLFRIFGVFVPMITLAFLLVLICG